MKVFVQIVFVYEIQVGSCTFIKSELTQCFLIIQLFTGHEDAIRKNLSYNNVDS